jgi:hypothetical protein
MESIDPADRPRHGCMECKAQRWYTIEPFPNGNTGWRVSSESPQIIWLGCMRTIRRVRLTPPLRP